jgi:hypothetical protein
MVLRERSGRATSSRFTQATTPRVIGHEACISLDFGEFGEYAKRH